jgi:hypothetical protein
MQDLIAEMTHVNPEKRPSIEDVMAKFSRVHKSLSGFKLGSPIIYKQPSSVVECAKQALHIVRYMLSYKSLSVVRSTKQALGIVRHILSY